MPKRQRKKFKVIEIVVEITQDDYLDTRDVRRSPLRRRPYANEAAAKGAITRRLKALKKVRDGYGKYRWRIDEKKRTAIYRWKYGTRKASFEIRPTTSAH